MKRQLGIAGGVCVILLMLPVLAAQMVQAQEYPTKPVTLVIPLAPGGIYDLTTRTFTPMAEKYLGQPLITQFRVGGGGTIGSMQVASAVPDGYTLLHGGSGPNCQLPAVEGRSAGPDNLEAVCRLGYYSSLFILRLNAPFKNFKEMVQYAKAKPNTVVFANTGPWGSGDVQVTKIMMAPGIPVKTVPYDGAGPATIAVLGGHADICGVTPAAGVPYVKAGKVLPLVILQEERHPDYPDVPTAKELGVNVVYEGWTAILAPKGTPPPIINKLAEAFKKMTEDDTVKEVCKRLSIEIKYMGPDEFNKRWRVEYEEYKELGKYFKK